MKEEGIEGTRTHLKNKQHEHEITPIKIAVIGACKAGKSSFIYTIRNLEPDDEGAVEVGIMQKTQ